MGRAHDGAKLYKSAYIGKKTCIAGQPNPQPQLNPEEQWSRNGHLYILRDQDIWNFLGVGKRSFPNPV